MPKPLPLAPHQLTIRFKCFVQTLNLFYIKKKVFWILQVYKSHALLLWRNILLYTTEMTFMRQLIKWAGTVPSVNREVWLNVCEYVILCWIPAELVTGRFVHFAAMAVPFLSHSSKNIFEGFHWSYFTNVMLSHRNPAYRLRFHTSTLVVIPLRFASTCVGKILVTGTP